jgi:polyisoprenoid-binding protein YceI
MKSISALSILFLAFTSQAAVESTLTLKPSKGDVQIEAVGRPAMVKIKGKGEGPTGALKIVGATVTGDITFTLDTLDTGIDLRNEHMKEKYLETKKHPKATLTLKEVALPAGWTKEKPQVSGAKFKGELTLHGEKKPVEGTFEVTENKELKAKMELKISDYKIDIPSYLGITVADTVKVQISSKEIF